MVRERNTRTAAGLEEWPGGAAKQRASDDASLALSADESVDVSLIWPLRDSRARAIVVK